MINVQFTKEELSALVQLIDLAVKHSGMAVAEASVILTRKLQSATSDEAQTPSSENADK